MSSQVSSHAWPVVLRGVALCFLAGLIWQPAPAQVNLEAIESPIIFEGDHKFAYRDPAVVYVDGVFHLFFTLAQNAEDGGYYNFTAKSTSRDLIHWSYPRILTPKDRNLNFSSPGNIIRYEGQWILCLQTYPTPNKERYGNKTSRLWIMRSDDLENWSEPELLRVKGPAVPQAEMGRMIDPYLVEDADQPGRWWCFFKQNGASMSYSDDLKRWTYVGRIDAGENVTILRRNDQYIMFHSPENGIGDKRSDRLDAWGEDTNHIYLGQENWPWASGRLTAATVIDLTSEAGVGKYLMFFHGSTKAGLEKQSAHGEASLGIAWSDDLQTWHWPGK
jgi:hypothetical protein